ncbi:LOW QUALITY PROTEIN: TBC1 domain family member 19 [Lates calcarifer]|uniref:LOW QUALITY PROTEIN: TBC1 domain family member 19 n=1 Tax=Lates calcarifer TaxID=8187 RepID=A0AAJ7VLD7_LATCA|nr:LOW QUALITY PROTEIN: TBC1 domain family member 19 [Lates calcarifer]
MLLACCKLNRVVFGRKTERALTKRMDESTELSLTIAQIVQRLKGSHLHSQIERQAKECLHQPDIKLESLKEDVRSFLKTSGWERKLQNAVYRELHVQLPPSHPAAPPEHLKEPLAYMRKAQASWEKRVLKSLNSMSTELGVPLARMRPAVEQKELTNKWNEMGTDEPDLSRFRPVYAPKDFLEVLISLRNPNHDSSEDISARSHWGLIQVPLNVRDIPQLRQAYSELNLTTGQLGIDDHAHVHPDLFENDYVQIGKKVVADQDSAAAQQYSRQGCPTGLRAELWALILNSTNQPPDVMHYEQLKAGVIQHDLLVDNLIYKDVKLTASNDDYYFVFEDFLYQVLLCFSRDTAVLEHFKYNSATPPKSYIQGKVGEEECAVVYPPNGVIPFHGFSMYVAPLCFLYNEPSKLYSVFREMYIRYFFRLHSISSSPSGIVSLCLQFERLLQTHLPQLFYHLRQIGAQPLRIAFKWMVRAFSGYLSTDQLLLLWDRILGYDSLEVVAVLAAAVFAFRAENLMEVTSLASAEAVLADLSTLKVMPLIQIFLFATAI